MASLRDEKGGVQQLIVLRRLAALKEARHHHSASTKRCLGSTEAGTSMPLANFLAGGQKSCKPLAHTGRT